MKKMKKDSPPRPHKSSASAGSSDTVAKQKTTSTAIGAIKNQIEVNTTKTVLQKSSTTMTTTTTTDYDKRPPRRETVESEAQDHEWPDEDGCG